MKFVELEKMNKKEKREYYKKFRRVMGFNTGTREMHTPKFPSRARQTAEFRRNYRNYI